MSLTFGNHIVDIEFIIFGFSSSIYSHVRPYTPYFGSGYRGIKGVPTMWPPMSNPLTNPMI